MSTSSDDARRAAPSSPCPGFSGPSRYCPQHYVREERVRTETPCPDIAPLDRHRSHVLIVQTAPRPPASGQFEPGADTQHGGLPHPDGPEKNQRFRPARVEGCRAPAALPVPSAKCLCRRSRCARRAMHCDRTHPSRSLSANNELHKKRQMIITRRSTYRPTPPPADNRGVVGLTDWKPFLSVARVRAIKVRLIHRANKKCHTIRLPARIPGHCMGTMTSRKRRQGERQRCRAFVKRS